MQWKLPILFRNNNILDRPCPLGSKNVALEITYLYNQVFMSGRYLKIMSSIPHLTVPTYGFSVIIFSQFINKMHQMPTLYCDQLLCLSYSSSFLNLNILFESQPKLNKTWPFMADKETLIFYVCIVLLIQGYIYIFYVFSMKIQTLYVLLFSILFEDPG